MTYIMKIATAAWAIILAVILVVLSISVMTMSFLIKPTFISPLRRTQIILQCKEKSQKPLNAPQIFNKIIKFEGYRGLWKSYLPFVISLFVKLPIRLILGASISSVSEEATHSNSRNYIVWILVNSFRDLIGEGIPSILTYPLDFAEIKLANDAKSNQYSEFQYKGVKDLFKKTLLNDGILKLYSGIEIYLFALIGFKTMKWSLLALMHSFGLSIYSTLSIYLARYFAVSLFYPFIVLKSRAIVSPGNYRRINIRKSFTNIIKNDGFPGLYKGYLLFVLIKLIS